uniref:Uncharacterized protein n=1 Tax=Caenorhabditis japonica TaxID=281687 RepID=A0A8R1EKN0_CAEJA
MRCPTLVFLLIVNCIFLLTGLILLVAFPNWIVNKIAAKVMYIHEDGTGKSSFVTDYWERLPAVHIFKFYMFNITNPDDVMFHGHEPILQELGPYTYEMTEVKENIRYSKDGNLVSYRANKTWVFNPQKSCATCRCEDQVAFPNLVFTALIYYARTEKINIFYRRILDIFILIMRSKPIQNVGVCDILLNSYKDPIIEVIHTPIYKTLKKTLKLTTPDFPDLGYLPKYNRTGDGDFVVMTGKDDIANIGQIVSWNNWTELPWWNTPESRRFKGSGDGINQKPGIGKHDKYEMYQPLACRKFTLEYSGSEAHVNGIPALAYSFVGDSYDGVRNIGYRYENYEKMNYYPGWPCGLNHTVEVTPRCKNVKCDLFENWCDKCCNGSFINETWVLPPGIIPLRCQPGE